ncbi:MAG: hypothetical protein ACLU3D_00555 [Acutalibacteraceae bacterium]|jgi:hypothetical protein
MRFKKDLILVAQRCLLHIKSMGLLFYMPILVSALASPLFIWFSYRANGNSSTFLLDTIQITQLLFPFFSAWWPLLLLREYVGGKGRELLYVNCCRARFVDLLVFWLIYVCILTIVYGALASINHLFWMEYLKMMCICISFAGAAYCLAYLFLSLPAVAMILLLYTFSSIAFYRDRLVFPLYYSLELVDWRSFYAVYFPMAGCGIMFWLLGILLNLKRKSNSLN